MKKIYIDFEMNMANTKTKKDMLDADIIAIGAIKYDTDTGEIEKFKSLVKPITNLNIFPHIQELTNISQEDISKAPSYETVMRKFKKWLGKIYQIEGIYTFGNLDLMCFNNTDKKSSNKYNHPRFVNNIKNISNSQIQNTTIRIPSKIIYDSSGLITFQIESTFKQDNYTKKYRANVEINTDLNFFNTSDEIENKFETLGINNLNKFTDTYDKTINYEKENNLESENKTDKILDSNNETINNDKNIENDKVEIEDENNIKIKNIDPSSIVTVYDYKEI